MERRGQIVFVVYERDSFTHTLPSLVSSDSEAIQMLLPLSVQVPFLLPVHMVRIGLKIIGRRSL